MTDQDVVERVATITGSRSRPEPKRNPAWKQAYRVAIKGQRAADLMEVLCPLMGKRRQEQIGTALRAREDHFRITGRPPTVKRLARNLEIARRMAAGESGVRLAQEFGVTHQNIYYIRKRYRNLAS